MKKDQHLLLIDGMALLFRAFFATAVNHHFMINGNGVPTNAVQGYLRHLLTAVETVGPTHVAVSWDMGSVTFRNEIYSEYKANRQAPPVEMQPQFDLAKEATTAFGIPNIGVAGYEADDCIGTIAKKMVGCGKVTVVTGDRDLLQILEDNAEILLLQKGMGNYRHYTKEVFIEEYGISPKQLVDVKALMGDPSDGYPGVKGIGEKTALKLIQQYGSVDGVLSRLDELKPAQKKKISEDIEMLKLSLKLAAIDCEVPLPFSIDPCLWGDIPESAYAHVSEHELKTVRNHLVKYKPKTPADEVFGSRV